MDGLLVPVETTKSQSSLRGNDESHLLGPKQGFLKLGHEEIGSPERALEILRSRPQQDDLHSVFKWLHPSNSSNAGFDIHGQTLQASQIIHTLVNDVLPNYWSLLSSEESGQSRRTRDTMILIMSNVSGISMLLSRLKTYISRTGTPEENRSVRDSSQVEALASAMSMLEAVLEPKDIVYAIWTRLCASTNLARRWLLWKELVTLLGGGRVLSTASEADAIVEKSSDHIRQRSWLSDGSRYCFWLGRNLNRMLVLSKAHENDTQKAYIQMLDRALTLGHVGKSLLLYQSETDPSPYASFTKHLGNSTKKVVVYSLLRNLNKTPMSSSSDGAARESGSLKLIRGIAAFLDWLSEKDEDLASLLVEWLSGDGIVQDLRIRRAVVAALAEDLDTLKSTLTDALRSFGDKLYIKHAPVLHQEGMTENLLLLIGYAHRKIPPYITDISRSSPYLNAISNRLAAPSHRVSVLGMYLGTALSRLVDPPEKRMNFGSEEMTSAQGQRYLSLTEIRDPLGSRADLRHTEATSELSVRKAKKPAAKERKSPPGNQQASTDSKIISIEEVDDESEPEDEDLPMYAKPDSDASDSDEDPTVIERSKPTAPVYINDLVSGLRDTENYDRHFLALTHASPLIRRKAAFGTEVTDNAEEIVNLLTSLGDKWNIENFQELRLQGMIAVLVAQPLEMGQWFSRTYFNGDYSIQQRATVLTTLGLGARELAGYGKEDKALSKFDEQSFKETVPFPSKQLPPKLHALYTSEKPVLQDSPDTKAINTASRNLEQSILQPMALQAADALSGPNALKVRTFSSRMEVEKRRTKPIPNALAKIVADEFLSLILSLRSYSIGSLPVMEALLFAFLTVLEVNTASDQGRRLAAENVKALLEMGEWVEGVLGNVRGDGEEEGRVKALAAGCVGRVREVVEREERVLVGELVGMM
ncbi:MAG: hypothetical protein Q9221_006374 [Calogaya cf. arnoldii]